MIFAGKYSSWIVFVFVIIARGVCTCITMMYVFFLWMRTTPSSRITCVCQSIPLHNAYSFSVHHSCGGGQRCAHFGHLFADLLSLMRLRKKLTRDVQKKRRERGRVAVRDI